MAGVIERAYELTHADGTCVLVGVPSEKVTIPADPFRQGADRLAWRRRGPHVDIPRLIKLVAAGKLSLDGIITHEFPLAEINAALDLVRSGAAGRVLVNL